MVRPGPCGHVAVDRGACAAAYRAQQGHGAPGVICVGMYRSGVTRCPVCGHYNHALNGQGITAVSAVSTITIYDLLPEIGLTLR